MLASIDVGTNTVRLLIGNVHDGKIRAQQVCRRITRLGGGLRPEGLAPEAARRTLDTLREMASLCRSAGVRRLRAVGTAVLRNSADGPSFAEKVRQETGLPLEIIEGDEEARLAALGVRSVLDPAPETCLIMDIGGGSTEFILFAKDEPLFACSCPLGVVSLCERFPTAGAQEAEISRVLDRLAADLERAGVADSARERACPLVGTAGTVTTLAALKLRMRDYDAERVNNLVLHRTELREMAAALEPLDVAARESLPGIEKGRGDLIPPGIRIVLAVLERFVRDRLIVSDAGLLEGVLLSLADDPASGIAMTA